VNINPIGVAVPLFFVLLGLEILLARRTTLRLHRLNDSMADLACGMGDQLIGIFTKAIPLAIYTLVEGRYGLLQLNSSAVAVWAAGMLLVDHQYYWYHRFSHRVNLGWATHVVHHQSEEFNLAVALRQPWFTQFYNWIFYLPLALLGIPALVWAGCYALNLLYQFWIHTRLIDRLGPLEWVLNTPSHHRVHHGINDEYLDRNYAGVLIIWDRLYGTFEPEQAEVLYGTRRPLRSWNPLWANVEPLLHIARLVNSAQGLGERVYALVAPPEWAPDAAPALAKGDFMGRRGYDLDVHATVHSYLLAQLLPVAALMSWMLTFEQSLSSMVLTLGSLLILWTAAGWVGLLERRSWGFPVELLRHSALLFGLLLALGQGLAPLWAFCCLGFVLLSLAFLLGKRRLLV
tara:strand:- start:5408 stop:6613 length:1206 start_codon:yes stop_codon:yes gene_type:complete